MLTYQIFVFAHISRIEEEYHITGKDQTNFFCLLKRFSTQIDKNGKGKGAQNLRGSNEQKVSISLHEFKVVDGRLVAQKSHHITCNEKVGKKRSANEDPLRQTTINSSDAPLPSKKSKKKTLWLAYRTNIRREDAPTTKNPVRVKKHIQGN